SLRHRNGGAKLVKIIRLRRNVVGNAWQQKRENGASVLHQMLGRSYYQFPSLRASYRGSSSSAAAADVSRRDPPRQRDNGRLSHFEMTSLSLQRKCLDLTSSVLKQVAKCIPYSGLSGALQTVPTDVRPSAAPHRCLPRRRPKSRSCHNLRPVGRCVR